MPMEVNAVKRNKILLICILSILIGVFSACEKENPDTTRGDYLVYHTAESLVDASDFVFSGQVVGIDYERLDVRTESGVDSMTGLEDAEPLPYTLYEIAIIEKYKGEYESDRVILKCPGSDMDKSLADAAEIRLNEQYLFLAAEFPDTYPSLLNTTQAVWPLKETGSGNGKEAITLDQILEVFEE